MRASDFDPTFLLEISKDNEYITSLGDIKLDFELEYKFMKKLLTDYIKTYHSISSNSIKIVNNYVRQQYLEYKNDINSLLKDQRLDKQDNELILILNIERQRLEHITQLMKDAGLYQEETLDY